MKNYLAIMREQTAKAVYAYDKKPDLSLKDWKFVIACLVTLENIAKDLDDINAEHVKDKIGLEIEVLEDITGYKILEDSEEV